MFGGRSVFVSFARRYVNGSFRVTFDDGNYLLEQVAVGRGKFAPHRAGVERPLRAGEERLHRQHSPCQGRGGTE